MTFTQCQGCASPACIVNGECCFPKEALTPDANPLPCPFCGGHEITLIRRSNVHGAMGCDGCGAEGPAGQYTEAVALWNGRIVPAGRKPTNAVRVLEDAVDCLAEKYGDREGIADARDLIARLKAAKP